MKNLTKIFMAVVAGMFAFSCVTDTTVDPNVNLGDEINGGKAKTVLSVGIANSEELRTQLGLAGEQGYPMYWSNGDKISVNGVESNALALEEGEKSVEAEFGFGKSLSTPYCIAYPAAVEGQVKFAANQSHTNNTTFGDNVAAMWGYSENGEGVVLRHLTGVLKIGVVADASLGEKNLVYAQVSTIDRTPIAGEFAFDFENGKLGEPVKDASTEVISYSFGDGVLLDTALPTYLHIAVPAGVYQELYVTLYDEDGGVMYATVKAGDSKPLAAGKVREFKANGVEQLITYAPNAEVFVIREAADLVKLSEKIAEATASSTNFTKDVLFVADVDMNDLPEGTTWNAPNWDARYTVDGKKVAATILGNGYAVKNLKTPLFGKLHASIKGLHLRGVDINETANPNVGGFARSIGHNGDRALTVENCTTTGKIVVDCPNKGWKSADYNDYSSGGICGTAYGVTFQKITNGIDIEVKQIMASASIPTDGSKGTNPCVGGITGNSGPVGTNYTNFIDVENKGNIDYHDCSWTTVPTVHSAAGATPANAISAYIGGVVGSSSGSNGAATFRNLTNRGKVTLSGGNYAKIRIAGVAASLHTNVTATKTQNKVDANGNPVTDADGKPVTETVYAGGSGNAATNINNYGEVTIKNCNIHKCFAAGCVARSQQQTVLKEVHNHQSGKITVEESAMCIQLSAGGVQGWLENSYTVTEADQRAATLDSSNAAPITVKCKTSGAHTSTGEKFFRVGGVAGWTQGFIARCSNSGDVTVEADWFYNYAKEHMLCVAGGVGYKTVNSSNEITNSGNITAKFNITKGTNPNVTEYFAGANIGGVTGYTSTSIMNSENTGDVTFSGVTGSAKIGGISGHVSGGSNENNTNSGSVTIGVSGTTTTVRGDLCIAGGVGYTHVNKTLSSSGKVLVKSGLTANNKSYIAGVVGYTTDNGDVTSLSTYGNASVTIEDNVTLTGDAHIAGVIGKNNANAHAKQFTNVANVTVGGVTFGGPAYIGGVIGYTGASLEKHTNTGNISLASNANVSSSLHIGGVIGRCLYSIGSTNWLKNGEEGTTKGAITVSGTVGTYTCIGGCVGSVIYSQTSLENNENYGKVTVALTQTGEEIYVGGVLGWGQSDRRFFTDKDGKQRMQYLTTASGNSKLRTHLKNCTNEGAVEYTGNENCGPLMLGGVAGMASGNATTLANHGAVTIKGKMSKSPLIIITQTAPNHIGGVIGMGVCGYGSKYTYDGLTNDATVKIDNVEYVHQSNNYVGGIVGYTFEYKPYVLTGDATNGYTCAANATESSAREVAITNTENTGEVIVNNTVESTKYIYVGGIGGFLGGPCTKTYNRANITVHHNSTAHTYIGGVAWQLKDTPTDVENEGDITATGTIGGTLYIGGWVCNKNNYVRTRCNNKGDIFIGTESVAAKVAGNCYIGGLMYDGSDSLTQTFVDSHNSGNITLSSKSTVEGECLLAGMVGKVDNAGADSTLAIDGCSNSGNLTIKGDVKGVVILGGMVAKVVKGHLILKDGGFVNTGKIEDSGVSLRHTTASSAYDYIGGIIGKTDQWKNDKGVVFHGNLKRGDIKWTGTAENRGELVFSGKSNAGVIIGGILGHSNNGQTGEGSSEYAFPLGDARYISKGNITFSGSCNASSTWNSLGGVLGNHQRGTATKPLIVGNAVVDCTIRSWSANQSISKVGLITGVTRTDYVHGVNCSVAGTVDKGYYGDYTDDFGIDQTGYTTDPVTIAADNFFNHLYGTAVTAEVATGDSCVFNTPSAVIPEPTPEPEPEPAPAQ